MKTLVIVSRILMGLPLLVFGAAGWFEFMPIPAKLPQEESGFPPEAHAFMKFLWESGFLMHSACAVHMVTGALLLVNRFVPLALAIHLPVSIQMVLFHVFLDMNSSAGAIVVLVLNLFLMFAYRQYFKPLLRMTATLK